MVETIKEEDQGSKRHHDFMKRYFLQCDKHDKKLPFEILSKSLTYFQLIFRYFFNCVLLIEKKKSAMAESESIRQKIEKFYFEDEEKVCKYPEETFKSHMAAQEDKMNEHLLSVYQYIVGTCH
jgi:hypothetical protein